MSIALLETMRVRGGVIPFLERHRARLERSSHALGMRAPDPRSWGAMAFRYASDADLILRARWGGAELTWETRPVPEQAVIRLVTAREVHPGYPHKVADRAVFERVLAEARDGGADESLMLSPTGYVAEATRFAVGWIVEDVIVRAMADIPTLASLGQVRVTEIAPDFGLAVRNEPSRREALAGRSLFLVNAARGVIPVASLDGATVPRDERVSLLAKGFWPAS